MTWYKKSKLETFLDRNRINERITSFKQLAKELKYLEQYIYQNAPHAKQYIENLSKDKRMSSFPDIVNKLKHAASIALDNYKEFAFLCQSIRDDIVKKVIEMEHERNSFIKKIKLKGIDDEQ